MYTYKCVNHLTSYSNLFSHKTAKKSRPIFSFFPKFCLKKIPQHSHNPGKAQTVEKNRTRLSQKNNCRKFFQGHRGKPCNIAKQIIWRHRKKNSYCKCFIESLSFFQPANILFIILFSHHLTDKRSSVPFGKQKGQYGTKGNPHIIVYKSPDRSENQDTAQTAHCSGQNRNHHLHHLNHNKQRRRKKAKLA